MQHPQNHLKPPPQQPVALPAAAAAVRVNDEFGIHRVDLTSGTAWSCVAATMLFIACSVIIFSMRNKAVAFASLSLFVAYAGVVILLFVPRPKSFDCELMLIIWATWVAYGTLLKDTEWVFSGALSIIPTLAVLAIVFITYLPAVEKNRNFTSIIIFLFFFLLLFPQKEGLSFLMSVGSILLHTFVFVILFLVQDYEIVYRYGGHPIFNTRNRALPTTLHDIGANQSDQYYLYFISLKIIRTVWVLLVNRLSLLIVIPQIIYLGRSIYFIHMKGDGRSKAPPIVYQQQPLPLQQQQQQKMNPPAQPYVNNINNQQRPVFQQPLPQQQNSQFPIPSTPLNNRISTQQQQPPLQPQQPPLQPQQQQQQQQLPPVPRSNNNNNNFMLSQNKSTATMKWPLSRTTSNNSLKTVKYNNIRPAVINKHPQKQT